MYNMNIHALVVDDEGINRVLLQNMLYEQSISCDMAEDGLVALDMLENNEQPYDIILLDKMMPNMDGIDTLKKIKSNDKFKELPVIMQTADHDAASVSEGIKEGAFYYLTKPFTQELLQAIINSALERRKLEKTAYESINFGMIPELTANIAMTFQTPQQLLEIISFFSSLPRLPANAIVGLHEILLNAIEHGNLEITYDEKTALNEKSDCINEIERRLQCSKYKDRYARIEATMLDNEIKFHISDQGSGFEWQQYMEISPERAFDNHGRGIALSRELSFTTLEYLGKGNEVICVCELPL